MEPYAHYLKMDEEELLLQLGAQSIATITSMGQDQIEEAEQLLRRALEEDGDERKRLIAFGARVLKRMSSKLHGMVCVGTDTEIAEKLDVARRSGEIAVATFLSANLVSFGVPVEVATIVSSALTLVVSGSLYEELCTTWDDYNRRL